MADVRQLIVVRTAGDEVEDVVDTVGGDIGGITLGTAGIKQPVGNVGAEGAVQLVLLQRGAVFRIGLLGGFQAVFVSLIDEGLLVALRVSSHLGGQLFLESGQLFIGEGLSLGLGVVIFRVSAVGLEHGVGDQELPVGHGVIAVGVSGVFRRDLLVGVGKAVLGGGGVAVGQRHDLEILAEVLLVAARAVDTCNVAAGVRAVVGGIQRQGGDLRVDGSLLIFGERVAVSLCRVIEGIGVGSVDQALIGEVIGPGLAGLFVIDLLVERRVGVDDVAHEVAVLVLHVAVGAFIEVVDHRGRQLVRADGGSRGVGSEEAARQHVEEHDDADDQNSADGNQRRLQALAHTFLCFVGSCGSGGLFLALVLFAGCAHVGSFLSLVISLSFAANRRQSADQAIQCVLYRKQPLYASKILQKGKSNSEKGRSAVPAAPAISIVPPRGTPH